MMRTAREARPDAALSALVRTLMLLVLLAPLLRLPAHAEIAVPFDDLPGAVLLPDNWRPIPRAEVQEARERAAQANQGRLAPLPVAAFQRLPTLQWFTLPHALVYWQAGPPTAAEPAETGASATEAVPAPDLRLSVSDGRSPLGTVHAWHGTVIRHDGRFTLDLYTRDDDGRALWMGLAAGLRDTP